MPSWGDVDWLLSSLGDPAIVIDQDGTIVRSSRTARLFLRRRKLEGIAVDEFVPPHVDHPPLRHGYFLAPTVRKMGTSNAEVTALVDGEETPVAISLMPLDIDEETFVVATLNIDIPAALGSARTEADASAFVASTIHHDLAREVNALDWSLDAFLAGDEEDPKDTTEAMELVREAMRMVTAVAELAGRPTVVDPQPVLASTLGTINRGLEMKVTDDGTPIMGSEPLLRLIVTQIVRNALSHGEATELSVVRKGERLTIRDNGNGADPVSFAGSWERSRALIASGTTGKGLRIIRRYTAAMSGVVEAEATTDSGIEFRFTFKGPPT